MSMWTLDSRFTCSQTTLLIDCCTHKRMFLPSFSVYKFDWCLSFFEVCFSSVFFFCWTKLHLHRNQTFVEWIVLGVFQRILKGISFLLSFEHTHDNFEVFFSSYIDRYTLKMRTFFCFFLRLWVFQRHSCAIVSNNNWS